MKPGLKRALKITALVFAILVGVPLAFGFYSLARIAPIEDGLEPVASVRLVKDGFVVVGVVDLGDGKVALVDAGGDPDGRAILAELARRKLGPEAVTAVLITHGHGDHIAACHLFPGAQLLALEGDVALVEGRAAAQSPVGKMAGVKATGLKVSRSLTDHEELKLGQRTVRVYAVPGHTAGSAAYLIDGVLFVGDSLSVSKGGALEPAPYVFSDDTAQNRASLRALVEALRTDGVEVKTIVPGHSGTSAGIGKLAELAIAL
jgi:glyoxylase-like metal-dependent hydrolase (beta-lactamase superfamily II)